MWNFGELKMAKEDKSVEETKKEKHNLWKKFSLFFKRILKSEEEELFPPKMKWWEWFLCLMAWAFMVVGLAVVADQLCFRVGSECFCCTYIALGFTLAGLIIYRLIRHRFIVHKARLEDRSEVEAMFAEARTVVELGSTQLKNQEQYEQKKEQLKKEMQRIKDIGYKGWTEYQVLQFNQMLVEFLQEDELIGRAQLTLGELKEYAHDSAYRYEWEQFYVWEDKIEGAIKNIEDAGDDKDKRGTAVAVLRARLKTLLEYVADYYAYWAEGSAIIRGIITSGVMVVPILLSMGLLPVLHSAGDGFLRIHNWGLLGITGAITAMLLSLRKSDFVEVGSTEGKKELWRAVIGVALGLVAGILVYSMIGGGLLSGAFFPTISSFEGKESKELGLSIFWAIAAGYSFEWVFDHLRSATERRS